MPAQLVSHASAAYAGLPGPVTFNPPLPPAAPLPEGVTMPACPACGEGTEFLYACGKCGRKDGAAACCGEYPSLRGAYVSVLPSAHSWLGCSLIRPLTADA